MAGCAPLSRPTLAVMLATSWIACGWCVRFFAASGRISARSVMGAVGFLLLMGTEFALSVSVFGQPALRGDYGQLRKAEIDGYPGDPG